MKSYLVLCLVILTAMLTVANADTGKKEIAWAKSYDAAIAQAKIGDKIIMIDFYTDWCGWCKVLDTDVYTNSDVIAALDNFVCLKLNAEKEGKDQAAKFIITGYPYIAFIDSTGSLVGQISGYAPAVPFCKALVNIAADRKELVALEAKYAGDPKNVELATILLGKHLDLNNTKKTLALLVTARKAGPKEGADYLSKMQQKAGDALRDKRQYDGAIMCYQMLAKGNKDIGLIASANFNVAVCHANNGKLKEALDEFNALIKMPGCPDNIKSVSIQNVKAIEDKLKETAQPPK